MRTDMISRTMTALFLLISIGLFYTQIIRYGYYSRLAKNNSIRIIPIDGPRGNMFDRNGVPLVTSRLSFDVSVVYQEVRSIGRLRSVLGEVLGMSGESIMASLDKASRKPYAPVTMLEDADQVKAILLEEASLGANGIIVETRSKRSYLYGSGASHVFGYLGEISSEELEDLKDYGYQKRDLVGKDGLEKYYDRYLKGVDGGIQVEVDSLGRQRRVLAMLEPSSGKDLYLTIDIALQLACDRLLGDRRGAVIAMDPITGEVLALASHPAYDPNIFLRQETSDARLRLLSDRSGRPLSNRAISGTYQPGSVFKIVTASAALETKKITPKTTFTCNGSYVLGKARFNCWKEAGHGPQNIIRGLMNSCNVFFYNAGRLAGPDRLEAFAKLYGFGRPTGIDLPDEVVGVVPGRVWKKNAGKGQWYEGDTVNYSIGQGYLLVTPAQVLDMIAVIANNGSIVRPYIVKKIGASCVNTPKPVPIGIKDATIREVREGLFEVVNNEEGTGRRAKLADVIVAGKTGTAQNPHGRTHAWFAGFAPFYNPKICLVVFVEHGGKGGIEPAEIVQGIFTEAKRIGYF
jgi:penicillin-binding protein 2